MQLKRWEPWSPDLFDIFRLGDAPRDGYLPVLDIADREGEYLVDMDLPGFRSEDVDVSVNAGLLTITGERVEREMQDGDRWLRRETRTGRFERQIRLPKDVDPEKVAANFENGVLTVSIPKVEKAQPRKIEIQSGSSAG
ncbi:MAG: Hsp20/alpha crystallin family protein [Acidimicrobiia bacterium]|nr:Hsp20/alpha crystallin family protein [Acidimicrobiia bacterium]